MYQVGGFYFLRGIIIENDNFAILNYWTDQRIIHRQTERRDKVFVEISGSTHV